MIPGVTRVFRNSISREIHYLLLNLGLSAVTYTRGANNPSVIAEIKSRARFGGIRVIGEVAKKRKKALALLLPKEKTKKMEERGDKGNEKEKKRRGTPNREAGLKRGGGEEAEARSDENLISPILEKAVRALQLSPLFPLGAARSLVISFLSSSFSIPLSLSVRRQHTDGHDLRDYGNENTVILRGDDEITGRSPAVIARNPRARKGRK